MKVIVVFIAELLKTPPALSVIKALDDLGHEVIVCTIGNEKTNYHENLGSTKNVKFEYVNDTYEDNINAVNKLIRMNIIRIKLWETINRYYDDDTLLWVISDVSVKHLGKRLVRTNYIIHFLELIEDMYYISGSTCPLIKMDRELYVNNAKAIVECEYNRAHITKAWWKLKELPLVLANKPYNTIDIHKHSEISSTVQNKEIIEALSGRKIVLYQGNFSKERPLDGYIKAVRSLGQDWAFVMMLNSCNPYPDLIGENIFYIPFVAPPFHLEITSHAYIGVLSYTPVKNSHSILNTLYCAPNKIWEYSKFGVPMISNDLPALKQVFETKHIGECTDTMSVNSIVETLNRISEKYSDYSKNALNYYNEYNFKEEVNKIVRKCSKN